MLPGGDVQMSKLNRRNGEIGGTGRWSAKRKAEAVLRLVKGDNLDTLSRQVKVTAATLSEWREVFLANGLARILRRMAPGNQREAGAAMDTGAARSAMIAGGRRRTDRLESGRKIMGSALV